MTNSRYTTYGMLLLLVIVLVALAVGIGTEVLA
jgi:putative copper export protein